MRYNLNIIKINKICAITYWLHKPHNGSKNCEEKTQI